jgi:hypothetical protein
MTQSQAVHCKFDVGKNKNINESKETMKLKRFNQNRTTLDSTREAELLSSANTGCISDFY